MQAFEADRAVLTAEYGDINILESSFGELELKAEDGDIRTAETHIKSLVLENEYGNTKIEKSTVNSADLLIEDGDMYLDAEGLESLSGTNEYGDTTFVLYSSLSNYGFDLSAEYGDIILPREISEGILKSGDGDEMFYKTDGGFPVTFTSEDGDIALRTP